MRKLRVYGVGTLGFELSVLESVSSVEIFQFSDMHYETERYRDSTDSLIWFMRISKIIVFGNFEWKTTLNLDLGVLRSTAKS